MGYKAEPTGYKARNDEVRIIPPSCRRTQQQSSLWKPACDEAGDWLHRDLKTAAECRSDSAAL